MVTLSDASAAQPTFTAGDSPCTYVFQLVVNDGTEDSDPATVNIRIWMDVEAQVFVNASYSAMTVGKASDGSMDAPYTTLGDAITNANGGDLYVAAGTYTEVVTMVEGVSLYGGYEATSWTRDISTNTTTINSDGSLTYTVKAGSGLTSATVLDGFTITGPTVTGDDVATISVTDGGVINISNNIISGGTTDSGDSYSILFYQCDAGATISNNVVSIGTSTGPTYPTIAIFIDGCSETITISDNTISGSSDTSYSNANGIEVIGVKSNSAATITGNTIDAGENSSSYTHGMNIADSTATISRNYIDGGNGVFPDSSGGNGSMGMTIQGSADVTIENNIVYAGDGRSTHAQALADCVAIVNMETANADIINNTIYIGGNTTGTKLKGGIVNTSTGTTNVVNNLVINNDNVTTDQASIARVNIPAYSLSSNAYNAVYNNDLYGGSQSKSYIFAYVYQSGMSYDIDAYNTVANMEAALTTQTTSNGSNLNSDPLIQDGSDYLLQSTSPCIDAGCADGSSCGDVTIPTVDYDGNERGDSIDIGASEYTASE